MVEESILKQVLFGHVYKQCTDVIYCIKKSLSNSNVENILLENQRV